MDLARRLLLMKPQFVYGLVASAMLGILISSARSQNLVVNGSFETLTSSVTSDSYTVTFGTLSTNVATGWTFGVSGVNHGYNGIIATSGALGSKVIEDGAYGAFLQGSGTVYQTVTLTAGITYTLSFYAMGRDASTGGNGVNPIAVSLGSLVSQTIAPTNNAQNNINDWILYTYNFTAVTSGSYNLQFTGTLPYGTSGDHTTYIDNVSLAVSAVQAPSITVQPSSQLLYAGVVADFSVSASGTLPFYYRWRKNGTNLTDVGNIAGSATDHLTIAGISSLDATNYDVVITNVAGAVTSSVAQLSLVIPTTTYEMAVISNNPTAYYRLNEVTDPSSGTTTAYDYAGGYNGIYGVVVENGFNGINGPLPSQGFSGFETTNGAGLFSADYAESVVTASPWNLNTNEVTFTAWVNPNGPQVSFAGLIYCRGGGDGSGFNYTSFTDDSGNHTLGYTWNNDGNTWGWNSGLIPPQNVWSFVALVVAPTSATVYIFNTNGWQSATHVYNHSPASFFHISTIGQDSLDGTGGRNFNGLLDEVAVFSQAMSADQLAILYGAGSGISGFPPSITTEPPSIEMLYEQQTAHFNVKAAGVPSLSYQWKVETNGVFVDITDGGRISGATNATLTINNLRFEDATNYMVTVYNTAGSTNSSVVMLKVLPPPAVGTYASTVLSSAPIAYYRLNEYSDTLNIPGLPAFDNVGGFNGVYGSIALNSYYGTSGPLPSDGFPGFETTNGAALFSNSYDTSEIQVVPWNLNANTVTMTAWIYPTASQVPFTGLIACVGGADGSLFNFTGHTDINGNETLGYTWNNDGETWSWDSTIAPPNNQWSFVALTVTPTNATVYIINTNGVLSAVHTHDHAVEPFTGSTYIGSDPFDLAARGFNGTIDEVAIFKSVLTESQLSGFYDSAAGILTNVTITTSWDGSNLTLNWPGGTLLQSTNLNGPWTTNNSPPPVMVNPKNGAPQMFYRVRLP